MTEITRLKILKRIILALLDAEVGITKEKMLSIYASNDGGRAPSEKTFDRIKSRIKNELFLELKYKRSTGNYVLDKDAEGYTENIAHFFQFCEVFALLEIYNDGKSNYENFHEYIIPEERDYFKNNQYVAVLLKAINLGRQISFTYCNYQTSEKKEYKVSPIRLKEYLRRWYLVSTSVDGGSIRTFGLDRIQDLNILNNDKTTSNKSHIAQLKNYDDIVGLNYNADGFESIEDIELEVKNIQIKYLKSLKLHHSQQCFINDNGDWGKVTYKLRPNYEFVSQILKLGVNARVIKPQILRDDIAKHIKQMHAYYDV